MKQSFWRREIRYGSLRSVSQDGESMWNEERRLKTREGKTEEPKRTVNSQTQLTELIDGEELEGDG